MDTAFHPIKRVLAHDFEMPQLGKRRRITALLPHDYETSSDHYPVLYLHDGQNLFDPHAPYGSWGVDHALAVLAKEQIGKIIIVAIDHGEQERLMEYTPFLDTKFGPGDGKKHIRFVTDTLKPYVDSQFRTLPDRMHTGIGGSSMGGLVSIYAGLNYPEVYGNLMIFSPSLWVTPKLHLEFLHFFMPWTTRIYLYAGEKEGASLLYNVNQLQNTIKQRNLRK